MFGNISSNFCLFLFLFLLSIQSTLTLHCYECNNCTDIPSCTCNNSIEINNTNSYCILQRETFPYGVNIEIRHIPESLTPYHIYDPYYVSVEETIVYNATTERWLSISKRITYACDTDFCNKAALLKELPSNGLSLMLPIDWLNENLQRKEVGDLTLCRNCEGQQICVNSTDFNNITHKCLRSDCQGSCVIDETFKKAETTEYCYDSACTDDTPIGPGGKLPAVAITGIYYINKKEFQIIQTDVTCNAMDCTDGKIFKDIKEKLQKDLNNIKPFLPANRMNSIYSKSILFLMMSLFLQIFIIY
jgi:hypothetical protein